MPKAKTFFHDRLVLLILIINSLLLILCLIFSLLPLFGATGSVISEYRSNLGLEGYRAGHVGDIVSFGAFAAIVYLAQIMLGKKLYELNRPACLSVLALSAVLLIFSLIVVNSLANLR